MTIGGTPLGIWGWWLVDVGVMLGLLMNELIN